MPKSSRIILKFDHEATANAFRQIWNPSLPQFVQHINEMVNRDGIPHDLHVEQVAGNEYQFRYKSGSKGVVFVPNNNDIGVQLLDYDSVPLRTKYFLQTPQGFVLMIKTGDVDTKLEIIAAPIDELKTKLEEYEERIVEARKQAEKARKEQEEGEDDNPPYGDGVSASPAEAVMEVNTDEDGGMSEPEAEDDGNEESPKE